MVAVDREPPSIAGRDLAPRFGLRILALLRLAVGACSLADGAARGQAIRCRC